MFRTNAYSCETLYNVTKQFQSSCCNVKKVDSAQSLLIYSFQVHRDDSCTVYYMYSDLSSTTRGTREKLAAYLPDHGFSGFSVMKLVSTYLFKKKILIKKTRKKTTSNSGLLLVKPHICTCIPAAKIAASINLIA